MFKECLDLFGDRTLAMIDEGAKSLHPSALPRAFFESTMLNVSKRTVKQGCLMVNTVLELADVNPKLNQLATQKLKSIENVFATAFALAQKNGDLDTSRSSRELARLVMTINLGLRAQIRQKKSRKELESIIENSLSILGLAA